MKAYQIFQTISPELGRTLFQDLRDGHRDAYKGVLVSLATKRRLRPVFVQRKTGPQQIEWLYKSCQLKPMDEMAGNTLQVWLLRCQKDMLIRFLDQLGIEHDGDGTAEDLPETIASKTLKKAVDTLLGEFPPERVALYLHTFQKQQSGGWDNLRQLLESDPRLALGTPVPSPEPLAADAAAASAPKKSSSKKKAKSAGDSPADAEPLSSAAPDSSAAEPDSAETVR